MKLKVDKLNLRQLIEFSFGAREEDLKEFWIPEHERFDNLKLEEFSNTLCLYDEDTNDVYCIWGVEDPGSIEKVIWMLCTTNVEKHPVAFLRYCKEYIKGLLDQHRMLVNYVWLGNTLHVKWLEWMGAKFGEKKTINNEPFQYFYFMKE